MAKKLAEYMRIYDNVKKEVYNDNIYCSCMYERRDIVKNLGFQYDGELKLWYIPACKFNETVFNESQVIRFQNSTSAGLLAYYFVNYSYAREIKEMKKQAAEKAKLKKAKLIPKKTYATPIIVDDIQFLDDDE